MGEAKRRGTLEQRRAVAKPRELVTKGYMKIGADYSHGVIRGWSVFIHPDPAPDREPVRIVRGH